MTAIALPGAALELADLGQQEGWRSSCDLVGRAVRRLALGKEVGLNREHLATSVAATVPAVPRADRRNVWREMKRVTKPGGTIVIMDSIQRTDVPEMAFFVERFNAEMHEPFFREYQRDDLAEGLSKSVTARRV